MLSSLAPRSHPPKPNFPWESREWQRAQHLDRRNSPGTTTHWSREVTGPSCLGLANSYSWQCNTASHRLTHSSDTSVAGFLFSQDLLCKPQLSVRYPPSPLESFTWGQTCRQGTVSFPQSCTTLGFSPNPRPSTRGQRSVSTKKLHEVLQTLKSEQGRKWFLLQGHKSITIRNKSQPK